MSFNGSFEWSDHLQTAVEVLERSSNAAEAAEELTDQLQHDVSKKSLLSALSRAFHNGQISQPASALVGSKRGLPAATAPTTTRKSKSSTKAAPVPETQESQHNDPELMQVVRAVQQGIVTWHELADHLDLSPSRTKELVQAATEAGHSIQVNATGELTFELPPSVVTPVPDVPIDGKGWTMVGVMSDMHVGSKHCMEDDMVRFIERAYRLGVRQMLIPGDLCEGNLRHHGFQYEVKDPSYDGQVALLFQLLPELPGLKYYFCVGNHETNSWFKSIGMRPDVSIERDAQMAGRQDIIAVGALTKHQESAYLLLNPGDPETEIKVELSHTADKKAYAISYPLQKFVEAIRPGAKPHVLLKGHLHCHSFFDLRGVVCVQTGCFKDQGTWEMQKNMLPQVGGTVLWLRHEGKYFDVKHQWMAVRPAPMTWAPIAD